MNRKTFLTQESLNRAIKSVCDVLRRSNCTGAMQYIPELTWILFLRILDEQETHDVELPYRWQDWASPQGWKRRELETSGSLLAFVNNDLFPYLIRLGKRSDATRRQKIVSEIISNIGRTRIDTDYNLADALDKVDEIRSKAIEQRHIFPLSQVYEGLLARMGEKSSDGGQFFTPREIVRVIVRVVDPKPDEYIYDPCCGTGGFLAQAYEHMQEHHSTVPIQTCSNLYGREKENLVYPLALANLVLHGIDEPHIWHGNTLTGDVTYGGLFQGAPHQFDVVLTNPPFGGKESKKAQERFVFKSSSTQLLFLQHIIEVLRPGGRCGMVVDEGLLFRTNESAFVQTRKMLLETCNVWCIVSLPIGAFVNAGASIKTNLLFFTKGQRTERVWFYDLSDIKVSKKNPLSIDHFQHFFQALDRFSDTQRSWSVLLSEIEANGYSLKASNPNNGIRQDSRTLGDLVHLIKEKNVEIQRALDELASSRLN